MPRPDADIIDEKSAELVSLKIYNGGLLAASPFKILVRRWAVVNDDELKSGIAALAKVTTVKEPALGNGKKEEGEWRAVNVSRGKLKAREEEMGLYQVLVQGQLALGQWVTLIDDCQRTVEAAFFWQWPTFIDPFDETTWGTSSGLFDPKPNTKPGVTYSLDGLSFDKEQGLYSFSITRTTRIEQAWEYVAQSTLAGGKTTVKINQGFDPTTEEGKAKIAMPQDEKGVRRSLDVDKNGDCSASRRLSEERPSDLVSRHQQEDIFSSVVTEGHTENPNDLLKDANAYGAIAEGIFRILASRMNDTANFTTSETTETARLMIYGSKELTLDEAKGKDVGVDFTYTTKTTNPFTGDPLDFQTFYFLMARNVPTAEVTAIHTAFCNRHTDATISHRQPPSRNRDKTWDFHLVAVVTADASTFASDWINFTKTGLKRYETQFASIGGKRKRRVVTITYNLMQTRSAKRAYEFVDGGKDESHVETHGPNRYRAFKTTDISFGAWEADQ